MAHYEDVTVIYNIGLQDQVLLADPANAPYLTYDQEPSQIEETHDSKSRALPDNESSTSSQIVTNIFLQITTAHIPKDPSRGFVFGESAETCDIRLPEHYRAKPQQFALVVEESHFVFRNIAAGGTVIEEGGDRLVKAFGTHKVVWNATFLIRSPKSTSKLSIVFPKHSGEKQTHLIHWLQACKGAPTFLNRLKLDDATRTSGLTVNTRSTTRPPPIDVPTGVIKSRKYTYHIREKIGEGLNGVVHRASCRDAEGYSSTWAIKFMRKDIKFLDWEDIRYYTSGVSSSTCEP
jgi:hypothetical protein